MIAADTPPLSPPPAEAVVVSRRDGTEVIASSDTPLVLTKGPQREQAMVRQAIFITTSLSLTRSTATPPSPDTWRWTHQAFLQRVVCVSSITGVFACTEASVQPLPNAEKGEAMASPTEPDAAPESDAARTRLTEGLRPRAAALFEADRRQHVDPLLKAAGVAAVRPPATTARR